MKTPSSRIVLIRTGLILTIVAGLSVAGLNLAKVRERIEHLHSELGAQTAARLKAETDLAKTSGDLAVTIAALKQSSARLAEATAEREKADADATAQSRHAQQLKEDLDTANREREEAQAYLARYRFTEMEPEQVLTAGREIRRLRDELAATSAEKDLLIQKIRRVEASVRGEEWGLTMRAGLRGEVLVVDPKWRFLVLDVGEAQGVVKSGELLVSRDGKLLAKAKVSEVQKDRCVANLMPGWEFGEVMEGDQILPAHPRL